MIGGRWHMELNQRGVSDFFLVPFTPTIYYLVPPALPFAIYLFKTQ